MIIPRGFAFIAIFDVTPVTDSIGGTLGFIENYWNTATMMRFIEEIVSVAGELERDLGKRIHLCLKPKRDYNPKTHDPRYITLIRRLTEEQRAIQLIPFGFNMYSLLAKTDVAIVIPNSSPAYVADYMGVPAIYFDPTQELFPSFDPAPHISFASGRAELAQRLKHILSPERNLAHG